jgi:microcin C transport system substrate-binding protein
MSACATPDFTQTRSAVLCAYVCTLDRVLAHGNYAVPNWYSSSYRVAYKVRALARPAVMPKYYAAQSLASATWWATSADK